MLVARSIVVVEDDVEMRDMLIALLRLEGCEVYAFALSDDALDYAESTPRSLVVIFGALRLVASHYARVERLASSGRVRILLTTGADSRRLPRLAHITVLTKPFDLDAFLAAVLAA